MAELDSTENLVRSACGGDRRAFDLIVERVQARLEAQIGARLGKRVGSRLSVEDVLSETFACAFESLGRLRWQGEEAFYRWLGSIAEHLIRNASRKRGWDHLRLERDVPAPAASPSKCLEREERFDRLEAALNKLSPDHKKALVLARIEGLSVTEISVRMNRSVEAVKKLLARAIRELRRSFGDTESLSLPGDRNLNVEGERDEK